MDFKCHFQPRNHHTGPVSHTLIWQLYSKKKKKKRTNGGKKSDFSFLFVSYNQRQVVKCKDLSTKKLKAYV